MSFIEEAASGLRLHIRVTPRAKHEGIDGIDTDAAGKARLKVRVTAPPAEGAANERVIDILAKACGLPKSAFAILSGAHHRNKVLALDGGRELKARLEALGGK